MDQISLDGGYEIRLGHGPGWVVLNLYASTGNPLAAFHGDPDKIEHLARELLKRAESARSEALASISDN